MRISKEWLNLASTVCLIAASVAIVGDSIAGHLRQATQGGTPPPASSSDGSPGLKVGDSMPLENADWKAHHATLVLAVQKGCIYCEASVPFYRRLAVALSKRNDVTVFVIAPDTKALGSDFLSDAGLSGFGEARTASFRDVHVGGTPTLVAVDSKGLIQKIWRGKLTPDREQEVMQYVANIS